MIYIYIIDYFNYNNLSLISNMKSSTYIFDFPYENLNNILIFNVKIYTISYNIIYTYLIILIIFHLIFDMKIFIFTFLIFNLRIIDMTNSHIFIIYRFSIWKSNKISIFIVKIYKIIIKLIWLFCIIINSIFLIWKSINFWYIFYIILIVRFGTISIWFSYWKSLIDIYVYVYIYIYILWILTFSSFLEVGILENFLFFNLKIWKGKKKENNFSFSRFL